MGEAHNVIVKATSQLGYREGYNNYTKYPPAVPTLEWAQNQPWCQTFVSWVFQEVGLKHKAPVTASCAAAVQWYKDRGRFSFYPAVGAMVFYGPGGGSHVGIVVGYGGDQIETIEGNTNDSGSAEGNGVYRKFRNRRDPYVYGYGYPDYAEGVNSADPAWAARRPTSSVQKVVQAIAWPRVYTWNLQAGRPANDSVRTVQKALIADGSRQVAVTGVWDKTTKEAWSQVQRNLGFKGADADGIPGPTTLSFMANKYKFTIMGDLSHLGKTFGENQDRWNIPVSDVKYDRYPSNGSRGEAEGWVRDAMRRTGVPEHWFNGLMTIAVRESAYNPNAFNGWDSNAKKGIASRGIMQCIPPTFAAYHQHGTSTNIFEPIANICAAIRYIKDRYGDISNVQQANPNLPPKGY